MGLLAPPNAAVLITKPQQLSKLGIPFMIISV